MGRGTFGGAKNPKVLCETAHLGLGTNPGLYEPKNENRVSPYDPRTIVEDAISFNEK